MADPAVNPDWAAVPGEWTHLVGVYDAPAHKLRL
jgi:hypothetical protein